MAQEPANPRLWALVVAQAKMKFRTYPSIAASHWVHQRYLQSGGKFTDTSREKQHKEAQKKNFEEKKKAKATKEGREHLKNKEERLHLKNKNKKGGKDKE